MALDVFGPAWDTFQQSIATTWDAFCASYRHSVVAFQDTNFVTTFANAGATLLFLSFVFAAITQEFLASCSFLFVKHLFDVGDKVDIVGPEKELLVVEQNSLLFTVFKRIDSIKIV